MGQLLVAATGSISKTVAFRDPRFFLERSVTMQPRRKVVENFWIPISTVVWSIYTFERHYLGTVVSDSP